MTAKQAAAAKESALVPNIKDMANAIRALAMDAVEKANSGHPGMPMGTADIATVLFANHLKFDPQNPEWADRDRFVLSAGHGSMLLYSLLYLTGYKKMTLEQIKNFRQLHSITPGHPEVDHSVGIETTTGPLGQGISTAVGMALAERMLNKRFGDDLVGHYTYVIAGDGDLMEGISHEACALAGHLKLSRLIVMYDDNGISIDGPTSLSYSDDAPKRFEAYGWNTITVDGHDMAAVDAALTKAKLSDRPTMISCKTHIGYGAPTKQGKSSSHGSPLGAEEIAGARKFHAWSHEPFQIPDDVLTSWRDAGARHAGTFAAWNKRLSASSHKAEFQRTISGDISAIVDPIIADIKKSVAAEKPKLATRQLSGNVLEKLVPAIPNLVGGSADLTGSNNTKVPGPKIVSAQNGYEGQYIHYGVREHGMAAIMNGLTLHGGVVPYGGTFLTFADYSRPAIRLAALMKQRVIHVMTHDSIGLGEDGPTHQPVEHMAAMRTIPNLLNFRPADGVEVAECWQIALNAQKRPSLLALTRQALPTYRGNDAENKSAKGAYVLSDCDVAPHVTLFASGSEVEIAMEAKVLLEKEGLKVRVVSVPSFELFFEQDQAYRDSILANSSIKVGIEAAVRFGWDSIIGRDGIFIGMKGFGESAPYKQLYEHFGITPAAVVAAVKKARG